MPVSVADLGDDVCMAIHVHADTFVRAETARMFAAGLTLIRREHFATSTETPPRAQVDAAVARFIDNFIGTVLR